MNEDIFKGKWNQVKGKVKEKWGKLTDNDITRINGERDQLLGRLQERYGWKKDRAEEEMKKFEGECRSGRREEPNLKETHYKDEEGEEGEGKSKRRKVG